MNFCFKLNNIFKINLTTIIVFIATILLNQVESKSYKTFVKQESVKKTQEEEIIYDLDYETAEKRFINNNIVHRHSFNYIFNPGDLICGRDKGKDIFLLVYVHSAPSYFKRRLSIRETWGKVTTMLKSMRLIFMMGHDSDANVTSLVNYENNLYGDIVQEDFYDSYRNLTHKAIMALKWINNYCANVKYILKTDDDIIVNIFTLWKHLKNLEKYEIIKSPTIMCSIMISPTVIRDPLNKWFVSKYEYRGKEYGRYCSGSAFVLTPDAVFRLYNASQYVKFFWVDDYYITGLVARHANISHKMSNSLYSIYESNKASVFASGKQSAYVIFGHIPEKLNSMYRIWSYIFADHYFNLIANQGILFLKEFRLLEDFKWSV